MKYIRLAAAWWAVMLCAHAQVPNLTPPTPLFRAVLQNNTAEAVQLLDQGADPNEARWVGFSAVFFSVVHQNLAMFRALKEHGADITLKDKSGSNLLMWAAFNESGSDELVNELLRLGLDPNEADSKGDTAMTWALRRGSDTPAVRALRNAGGSQSATTRRTVENALGLLQKSSQQFVKVSGCTSCHHQSLPQMAIGTARTRDVKLDEQAAQQQVKAVLAVFSPLRDEMMNGISRLPNVPLSLGYQLLGLAAEGYTGDDTTRAMAHLISLQQAPDGSFRTLPARPPLESSDVTATAVGLRALQLYGDAPEARVQRAAAWLQTAKPVTTEDRVMQLLGLTWAEASDQQALQTMAAKLLSLQREDGGWSQLPTLESDAYATGQALVALERSGRLTTTDAAYRRGVDFLLRTQHPDGSWLVRSRTFPFQALKDSGFPHGPHQWISAAGSSWAAMALSLSLPTVQASNGLQRAF